MWIRRYRGFVLEQAAARRTADETRRAFSRVRARMDQDQGVGWGRGTSMGELDLDVVVALVEEEVRWLHVPRVRGMVRVN